MPTTEFEILTSLPAYGPMYTPVSEDGTPFYSEGFVVRFYKADGSNWVANFALGITDFNRVIVLKNQNLLVIAGGTCYIMNSEYTQPVAVFGADYKGLFITGNERIVLYSNIDLTVLEPDGNYWHSDRISLDGLVEMKIENNNTISGLAYEPISDDDLWIPFTYNIDTKQLLYDNSGFPEVDSSYLTEVTQKTNWFSEIFNSWTMRLFLGYILIKIFAYFFNKPQ